MNYLSWAVVVLGAYSFVASLMKVVTTGQAKIPSNVVALVANGVLAVGTVGVIVVFGQSVTDSVISPKLPYVLIADARFTVGILSHYRALAPGLASIVAPTFGMFLVVSSIVGIVALGGPLTVRKVTGIGSAVLTIALVSIDRGASRSRRCRCSTATGQPLFVSAGQRGNIVLPESDSELERGDVALDLKPPGTDSETYFLSSLAGYNAILIVLTCSHCPYARAKFEKLNHLASTYDDLAVVDIDPSDAGDRPEDSLERMQELAANDTIGYTTYPHDESQAVTADYGAVRMSDPFLLENADDGFKLAFHSHIDDAVSPNDEVSDYKIRTVVEALPAGDDIPVEECPSQGCSIKWKDE